VTAVLRTGYGWDESRSEFFEESNKFWPLLGVLRFLVRPARNIEFFG